MCFNVLYRCWLPRCCEEDQGPQDPAQGLLLLQAFWYWCPHCHGSLPYQFLFEGKTEETHDYLQAFVHLLPTAFFSLSDPCLPPLFTEQYPPLPGAIMMASLFALFTIELWLNHKMGGHSHGGPTGEGLDSRGHGGHGHGHQSMAPRRARTPETIWEDEKRGMSKECVLQLHRIDSLVR